MFVVVIVTARTAFTVFMVVTATAFLTVFVVVIVTTRTAFTMFVVVYFRSFGFFF